MLAKYPQLIEFLEIPQLLNNCIRTYYYEDALQICNHISRFCGKHSHVAPIFKVIKVLQNCPCFITFFVLEFTC